METKKCSRCKEIKPVEDFYWRKARNRYREECKVCSKIESSQWKLTNPEKRKESNKLYREINKDKIRVSKKKYCKDNPEIKRDRDNRRRALKQGVITEKIDFLGICENHKWICGVCGRKIDKKLKFPNTQSISLDHIIPLFKGGNHITINIQPVYFVCNSAKGIRINNVQLAIAV